MPANNELRLIAKLLKTGKLHQLLDAGIRIDKFRNQDARLIFEYVHKYWRNGATAGQVPTRRMVEEHFPGVDLPKPDRMNMASHIHEFISHSLTTRLAALADTIANWKDIPEDALALIDKELREMHTTQRTTQDIVVSSAVQLAKQRYEESRQAGVLRGIPYPWDILNKETMGMQDGEYIIFYGRPKSLKSWISLKICTHAYDYASQRVLIYTREMSPEQMMDRCICLLIGAPYDAFKRGYLHTIPHPAGGTKEEAFYDLINHMDTDEKTCVLDTGKHKSIIITSDRQDKKYGGGISGLRRKVEDYKPDLIFVDAVYLMRNDRENRKSIKWTDQSAISQDLKDLAQDVKRPLLATLQANRGSESQKGNSVANISYSDSYGQDCDLAIEIIKKRIDHEHNQLALAITASREANIAGFAINGNPATDFSELMKQATDKYGIPVVGDNGEPIMEPVVFEDSEDIEKMFFEPDNRNTYPPRRKDEPVTSSSNLPDPRRMLSSKSKRANGTT